MRHYSAIMKKIVGLALSLALVAGLFPNTFMTVEAAANRVTMTSSVSIRSDESKVVSPVGNGYTIQSLTTSSSNKKVATAEVVGLSVRIAGVKRGRAVITTEVKAKKGTSQKTFTLRTTAKISSALPVVTVTTQSRLDSALKKKTPCIVRIVSYDGKSKTFSIPSGNHPSMDLEIDAAGATVNNKGTFRTVTIINISGGKYNEGAKANSLTVNTIGKSDIVVKKNAKVKTLATIYDPGLTGARTSSGKKLAGLTEVGKEITTSTRAIIESDSITSNFEKLITEESRAGKCLSDIVLPIVTDESSDYLQADVARLKGDEPVNETRIILRSGATISRILGNMSTEGHRDAVANKSEYTTMATGAYDSASAEKWAADHASDWTVSGTAGKFYDAAGRAYNTSTSADWATSGQLTIRQGANSKIGAVYVEQTGGVSVTVGKGATIGTIGSSGNAETTGGMSLSVTVTGGTVGNLIAGGSSNLNLSATAGATVKKVSSQVTGEATANVADSTINRLDQFSESAIGLTASGTSKIAAVNATGSGEVSVALSGKAITKTVNTASESKVGLAASDDAKITTVNAATKSQVELNASDNAKVETVKAASESKVEIKAEDNVKVGTVSAESKSEVGITAKDSVKIDSVKAETESSVGLKATDSARVEAISAESKSTVDLTATENAGIGSVSVNGAGADVSVSLDGKATLTSVNVSQEASKTTDSDGAAVTTKVDVQASGQATITSVQTAAADAQVTVTSNGSSTVSEVKITGEATATLAGNSSNATTVDISEATAQADITVSKPGTEVAAGNNTSGAADIVTNNTGASIPVTTGSGEGSDTSGSGDSGTTIPPQQQDTGGSSGGGYTPDPTPVTPTPTPTPTPVTASFTYVKVRNYKDACNMLTVKTSTTLEGDSAGGTAVSVFKIDGTAVNGVVIEPKSTPGQQEQEYTLTASTAITQGSHTITVENAGNTVDPYTFSFDPTPRIRRPELEAALIQNLGGLYDGNYDIMPTFMVRNIPDKVTEAQTILTNSVISSMVVETYEGRKAGNSSELDVEIKMYISDASGSGTTEVDNFNTYMQTQDRFVKISYKVREGAFVSEERSFLLKSVSGTNSFSTGSKRLRVLKNTSEIESLNYDESPIRGESDAPQVNDVLFIQSTFIGNSTYQWKRGNDNIGEAVSSTYKVKDEDRSTLLKVFWSLSGGNATLMASGNVV